ncbi:MAG TPA: ROK family protein [Levilinea sp.]|nr:ROK family protein [Levilinea sp.]
MNLTLILSCLGERGNSSRSQLAKLTGLTKATVSSLIKELIERKFVREIGLASPGIGRPSMKLEINPQAGSIIGAEIGVDFISVILTNFSAEILYRETIRTTDLQGDQEAILTRAVSLLGRTVEQARESGLGLLGIGMGAPGLVDASSGVLLFAPNLKWRDVPLRKILESKFSYPVYVENEANMATLGESTFGAGRDARYVLYVSAGVGLGGGIVVNKQLLQGSSGFAGEIGHMTIEPHGEPCNCGNTGCWETLVSQRAVFKRIREAALQQDTVLNDRLEGMVFMDVVAAARQGDAVTLAALNETGRHLGTGIANLVNALDPEMVIFGGILSLASEFILPAIQAEVDARALLWSRRNTRIEIARHGSGACMIGGVATVYHRILSHPTLRV